MSAALQFLFWDKFHINLNDWQSPFSRSIWLVPSQNQQHQLCCVQPSQPPHTGRQLEWCIPSHVPVDKSMWDRLKESWALGSWNTSQHGQDAFHQTPDTVQNQHWIWNQWPTVPDIDWLTDLLVQAVSTRMLEQWPKQKHKQAQQQS